MSFWYNNHLNTSFHFTLIFTFRGFVPKSPERTTCDSTGWNEMEPCEFKKYWVAIIGLRFTASYADTGRGFAPKRLLSAMGVTC